MILSSSIAIISLLAASTVNAFVPLTGNTPSLYSHQSTAWSSSLQGIKLPNVFLPTPLATESSNSRHLSSQLNASISADSGSDKNQSNVKGESSPAFITSLSSTLAIIALDVSFRKLFKALAISFPSSLAGCGALFTSLLGLYTINPKLGDSAYAVLSPGAAVLAKWLPVFFVPSLVTLPLAPSFGSGTEVRFCISLLLSLILSFKSLNKIRCGLSFTIVAQSVGSRCWRFLLFIILHCLLSDGNQPACSRTEEEKQGARFYARNDTNRNDQCKSSQGILRLNLFFLNSEFNSHWYHFHTCLPVCCLPSSEDALSSHIFSLHHSRHLLFRGTSSFAHTKNHPSPRHMHLSHLANSFCNIKASPHSVIYLVTSSI